MGLWCQGAILLLPDTLPAPDTSTRFIRMLQGHDPTHAGKMIMTVFAGIAEFERDLIQERTTAGRIAAQKRGIRFGRPRKLNADQEKLARRLVAEGKGVPEIAHTFNVHPSTIYRLSALEA